MEVKTLNKMTNIQSDIGILEQVIDALEQKLYHKALNICVLRANVYYKSHKIIEYQLKHNIKIDMVNGSQYALEYARHLLYDLDWELRQCLKS